MATDFLDLVKAELFLLRKRPSTWIILGLWLTVTAIFAYIFEYVTYRSGSNEFANTFDTLLPAPLARTISEGIPFYGGSLVLILGVLSIGSEFGWGTWKTILTQRPGRTAVFGAKMVQLGIALIPFAALAFAVGAVASVTIAILEDVAIVWPDGQSLVEAMLGGWLFLAVQSALFAFAAGAHFGVFTDMNDPGAGTAETVIAVALLAGLVLTFMRPPMFARSRSPSKASRCWARWSGSPSSSRSAHLKRSM